MEPNFECILYWRKSGCLSEADLGIFTTMLKGVMRAEDSLYMER